MNKLKAVKQVLLNRPLIYNVEFEDATIKVSKNRYGIAIGTTNLTIDLETKYKFDLGKVNTDKEK